MNSFLDTAATGTSSPMNDTPLCFLLLVRLLLLLQRAPGRWSRHEEKLLREMKEIMAEDLRCHPPFPEVVGSRRMLRFLR